MFPSSCQIASRNRWALKHVVTTLEEVRRHGPRFQRYAIRLAGGSYSRLGDALIAYQTELLGFCHDSIRFLRSGPKSE